MCVCECRCERAPEEHIHNELKINHDHHDCELKANEPSTNLMIVPNTKASVQIANAFTFIKEVCTTRRQNILQ